MSNKFKQCFIGEAMEDNGIRINKYLAECGVCSRRGADELIERGKVYVDGIKAEKEEKLAIIKKLQYQNLLEQDFNFLLVEFIDF